MKTISFKVKTNAELEQVIAEDSRICSSIYRYAFNRFQDKISYKEIYQDIASKFECNCHLKNSSIRAAQGLYKLNRETKVCFGQFDRYNKGLITKEELKASRNMGIMSEGEMNQRGNRLFRVDAANSKIIYKRAAKEHYDLEIVEKLSDKRKKILSKIELMMLEKKIPISIKVKRDKIYLTYDETIVEKEKQLKNLFSNRVLGIDLNPNYFGISIIEFDRKDNFKAIFKEVIDLNELQLKSKDKIRHELYEIDHHILKLCKTWHCGKVSVEDLKLKKSKKFWNKKLNKVCKNKFRYGIVKSHLATLCSTYGVECIEVNAAYSSIAGNFLHGNATTPDMVAASIEIARRAYKKFQKGWFYPSFVSKQKMQQVLGNQWKEELELGCTSWKGLGDIIKKSKLRYRFQLQSSNAVFSKTYVRKGISVYDFS